jgi:hypothetical protein
MKIRPVGAELFYGDVRTGSRDEANCRFSHFANAPNNVLLNSRTAMLSLSLLSYRRDCRLTSIRG